MPIPNKAKPISRAFMRDEVYNTLLSWIVEGELRPGEKLLDKELAEFMGVSRTPVREALRRLEDKQLVESSANRWTRVAMVSVDDPKKIYPIICSLEELAVSEAINLLTDSDFNKMAQANKDLEKAIEAKNPLKASKADRNFHDVFIARSSNQHLLTILNDLKLQCRRVEVIYFDGYSGAKHSHDEHTRILQALKSKNLPLSQAMIRSNWQSSIQLLSEISVTTADSPDVNNNGGQQ